MTATRPSHHRRRTLSTSHILLSTIILLSSTPTASASPSASPDPHPNPSPGLSDSIIPISLSLSLSSRIAQALGLPVVQYNKPHISEGMGHGGGATKDQEEDDEFRTTANTNQPQQQQGAKNAMAHKGRGGGSSNKDRQADVVTGGAEGGQQPLGFGVDNLQTFEGALGGIHAPPIGRSGVTQRPFRVESETFAAFRDAADKTCDTQRRLCQQAAGNQPNIASGSVTPPLISGAVTPRARFTGNDCDAQFSACLREQDQAPFQSFAFDDLGPDPLEPEYELFCEA